MEKFERVVHTVVIAGIVFGMIFALSMTVFAATSSTQSEATQAEILVQETWVPFNDGNECTVTAYCLCQKCCGKGWVNNVTASGVAPERYVTVANGSLPFGTRVYIEGIGYRIVQDRGSAVGPKHFDVYVGQQNHEYARLFGKITRRVWVVK